MTSITMPQLGESVAEGTIGKWLKAPGERIERDEPLVEVITDKVTAEIPSPVAGVVERIVVEEGQTVAVGREIAVIGDSSGAGAAAPSASAVASGGPTMDSLSGPPTPPAPRPAQPVAVAPAAPAEELESGERRRATPLVRKLATEHNVDISQLHGSGAGGRVTRDDVLAYVAQRGQVTAPLPAPAAAPAPPAPPPAAPPAAAPVAPLATAPVTVSASADEEYLPLTPMRRAIAEHMVRSRQTSPDAWGLVEVDVSALVRLRESLLNDWQRREGFELTFLPFFIKAVVESLREHPTMNASWGEDKIILKRRINVGIAVAVTDGLVVPVIPDADQRSIAGLAHAVRDLAVRARSNKLGLADLQGGTFTVNNTGALGSIMSQPIINQPQAGIVTMEAIVKRPVVIENDAIAIRSIMNVCLSFDHRILDGAGALRFLQSIKRRVEAYGPTTAVY
jgi:2-oxoisovalerate dehydrogenase E2 component (dihydrolipoyl transacylase)